MGGRVRGSYGYGTLVQGSLREGGGEGGGEGGRREGGTCFGVM